MLYFVCKNTSHTIKTYSMHSLHIPCMAHGNLKLLSYTKMRHKKPEMSE